MQGFQQFVVYPTRDKLPVFADATEAQVVRTVNRNTRLNVIRREGPHYIVRIIGQIGFVPVEEVSADRSQEPRLGDGLASGRHPVTAPTSAPAATVAAAGLVRADFMSRVWGYLIDLTILVVGSVLLGGLVVYATIPESQAEDPGTAPVLVINGIVAIVAFLYVWLLDATGATVGKMALGIQVVDDAAGRSPGLGKAFIRTLMRTVSGAALGLGYLWALWDREGKTWHDRVAGTSVVRYR